MILYETLADKLWGFFFEFKCCSDLYQEVVYAEWALDIPIFWLRHQIKTPLPNTAMKSNISYIFSNSW